MRADVILLYVSTTVSPGREPSQKHRLLGTLESHLLCLPVHCKGGVTARCIRRTCFPCGSRRYAHYSILWTSHGYDSRTIIKERGSPPNYPCPGTFSLGSLRYFCFVFPPLFLRSLFSAISLGRVPLPQRFVSIVTRLRFVLLDGKRCHAEALKIARAGRGVILFCLNHAHHHTPFREVMTRERQASGSIFEEDAVTPHIEPSWPMTGSRLKR